MSERATSGVAKPTETALQRRYALSRSLDKLTTQRHIKETARWWNQHVGMHFEEDIQSWVTNQFTKIDAKSNWANVNGSAMDESDEENKMFKAFRVARGRHIVSEFLVKKLADEAKKYANRRGLSEAIATGYVTDRLTTDGGGFDILGVTREDTRDQLLAIAA